MKPGSEKSFQIYLQPTNFIDSDSPDVIKFAKAVTKNETTDIGKAIKLYYAVRDGIRYDPYRIDPNPDTFKASAALERKYGFCVAKAILLAAVARVVGIPSRLGFADVKNHLTTTRLKQLMQSDIFVYHGYTELFLEEKWVKATPAFNLALCERFGVKPLEFDGRNDSIFHEFSSAGDRHMEYLRDHGQFADLPYQQLLGAFNKQYPNFFAKKSTITGDFEEEAFKEKER